MDGAAMDQHQPAGAPGDRVVSPQDKALASDWLKKIQAALGKKAVKDAHKAFARNRKLLRGIDPESGEKLRANLHFANLATMRPQVYAKDPEFSIKPKRSVSEARLEAVRNFCDAAEAVLTEELVERAKLKRRAKRLLTSAYTTAVGWWKLCWVEDRRTDPLVQNQLKDTQDNLARLQLLREGLDNPQARTDTDLQLAQLQQALAGLQQQAEVVVSRGLALDFVLSEDILVLDDSVRELQDYERAGAIAHRVWMTRAQYKARFGYDCAKGRGYAEQSGGELQAQAASSQDRGSELLCCWEVWDQDSNRVLHVCDGEEGFCCEPFTPDWTGQRWYPFFLLAFNETDGALYPLSDIELTEKLVAEYNESRNDFARDRKYSLPLNIIRKGGSLTDADVKRITNREGGDTIMVEGVGGQPISNDVWSGQLAQIRPENYDTSAARQDMEMLIGGGDAARGSVLKAKTATEAEILSQGLRGRSAERTDTMEDLLSEVGKYALQVCLRKLTPQEVARIAGEQAAASWPTLSTDEIFELVSVSVRGGSTGKPDRLQEQDRWTKLMPVIEKTAQQVAELRMKGQGQLAEALVQLLRETLRRFDERVDIEQFLPPAPKDGQPDPAMAAQELAQLKGTLEELTNELQALREQHEKGLIQAAAQVATSAQPAIALVAFQQALQALGAAENAGETPPLPPDDPLTAPQSAPPIQ